MKNYFSCLFLASCFMACSEPQNLKGNVSFSEAEEEVKMSEIITDYSLIKLETKGKNLILDVSMMRIWMTVSTSWMLLLLIRLYGSSTWKGNILADSVLSVRGLESTLSQEL